MKKTFKSSSFCNISIMVLFEIHQRFKGHFWTNCTFRFINVWFSRFLNTEAVVQRCSVKKVLKNFTKFWGLRPATLLKRGSGTGVFCEFNEVFKNTFFSRTHLVALLNLFQNTCSSAITFNSFTLSSSIKVKLIFVFFLW